MRYLIVILVASVCHFVSAQDKAFDCSLLQKSIETKPFKKEFFICKYPEEIVAIIDTNNFFQNCTLLEVCGRKVEIRHSSGGLNNKNNIIIYRIDNEAPKVNIYFYCPYTGAAVMVRLKKKNKIKVLGYTVGSF